MLRYADYDIVFQEIPGEVTLAINLSNCPNRCKGCHSPYLMDDIGEFLTEESLSWLLQKYGKAVTCVCFMGGDAYPLEVERLAQFLCCRQSIAPVKVGWYSGKSELPTDFNMSYFEYKVGTLRGSVGWIEICKNKSAFVSYCQWENGGYYLSVFVKSIVCLKGFP